MLKELALRGMATTASITAWSRQRGGVLETPCSKTWIWTQVRKIFKATQRGHRLKTLCLFHGSETPGEDRPWRSRPSNSPKELGPGFRPNFSVLTPFPRRGHLLQGPGKRVASTTIIGRSCEESQPGISNQLWK